ncbi:hypothetical protein RCL_jg16885.t1 [Rhizophagus clarus]|uniref:Uncharacterized protein n=1 Tax=Rhizophagus clarus TaxID=94130 RepID=A0A8H3LDC4_9GLOM|nr:hypothetical protein RCL_jg16885.t1 [Rhizophagus clarus]
MALLYCFPSRIEDERIVKLLRAFCGTRQGDYDIGQLLPKTLLRASEVEITKEELAVFNISEEEWRHIVEEEQKEKAQKEEYENDNNKRVKNREVSLFRSKFVAKSSSDVRSVSEYDEDSVFNNLNNSLLSDFAKDLDYYPSLHFEFIFRFYISNPVGSI